MTSRSYHLNSEIDEDAMCDCRPPDRPDPVVDAREAEVFCRRCGVVLQDRLMDMTAEGRYYCEDDGKDPSRVGAPENHGVRNGPALTVCAGTSGAGGGAAARALARQVTQAARASKGPRDRERHASAKQLEFLNDVDECLKKLRVPSDIRTLSERMFVYVLSKRGATGDRRKGVYAACVEFAVRTEPTLGILKSQIQSAFNVDTKYARTSNSVTKILTQDESEFKHLFMKGTMNGVASNIAASSALTFITRMVTLCANSRLLAPKDTKQVMLDSKKLMRSVVEKHRTDGKITNLEVAGACAIFKICQRLRLDSAPPLPDIIGACKRDFPSCDMAKSTLDRHMALF